jgi:hypothetical protein
MHLYSFFIVYASTVEERYFAVGKIMKAFEVSNTNVLNNFSFHFNVFSALNIYKHWWQLPVF